MVFNSLETIKEAFLRDDFADHPTVFFYFEAAEIDGPSLSHTYTEEHTHTCSHTRKHWTMHTDTITHTRADTQNHTIRHAHVHVRSRTHTYIHTHTHTHVSSLLT